METYVGTIMLFAGNFAPSGWAFCDGSTLPINQYAALYSLLGVIYGGDGKANFALPDLRSRAPVAYNPAGSPPMPANILPMVQAKSTGSESVALSMANMPAHVHVANLTAGGFSASMPCSPLAATTDVPGSNAPAVTVINSTGSGSATVKRFAAAPGNAQMAPITGTVSGSLNMVTQAAGTATPTAMSLVQPFVALSYIICLNGDYPTRP